MKFAARKIVAATKKTPTVPRASFVGRADGGGAATGVTISTVIGHRHSPKIKNYHRLWDVRGSLLSTCTSVVSSPLLHLLIYFCLFMVRLPAPVNAIGCFVCTSFNGTNAECEDTFNSTVSDVTLRESSGIYHFPCWAFKKNRQGLFPADHCVKVSGYQTEDPTQTLIIRTCALDSGTLTADTEIVRVSHCGHFKYDGNQYTGCVQACDIDGCNHATSTAFLSATGVIFTVLLTSYTILMRPFI